MPKRTEIKDFRFYDWQLQVNDGEAYFAPHYESDSYTADELRLIADELDRMKGE